MNIQTSERIHQQVNQIVVESSSVPGISAQIRSLPQREPNDSVRNTRPGYNQIIVGHDGVNSLLGSRTGWVTHLCHRSEPQTITYRTTPNDTWIYHLAADDRITHVTVAICELHSDPVRPAQHGLWQLIQLHRPGEREPLFLPRLLHELRRPVTFRAL